MAAESKLHQFPSRPLRRMVVSSSSPGKPATACTASSSSHGLFPTHPNPQGRRAGQIPDQRDRCRSKFGVCNEKRFEEPWHSHARPTGTLTKSPPPRAVYPTDAPGGINPSIHRKRYSKNGRCQYALSSAHLASSTINQSSLTSLVYSL